MLLLLLLVPFAEASAQLHSLEIPAGARLRVFAPALGERSLVGSFGGFAGDSLTLLREPRAAIRIETGLIRGLEVGEGRDRMAGAVAGGLIGLAGSVGLGFLCVQLCPTEPGGGANLAPVGGLFLGVLVGLPVGGLIGARVLAPERWRMLPVD